MSNVLQPELETLYESLAGERPQPVLHWLGRDSVASLLTNLGSRRLALTHATLDDLPSLQADRAPPGRAGGPPPRRYPLATSTWCGSSPGFGPPSRLAPIPTNNSSCVVTPFGRCSAAYDGGTQGPRWPRRPRVKRQIRATIGLLEWLRDRGVTLASCDQGHLDAWLAAEGATLRRDVGHFVRWARANKLTNLELPAVRWSGPSEPIDAERRWDHARWLLRDDTVEGGDRVGGLLVLLYAQRASVISRLTVDDVDQHGTDVRLHLGTRPVVLPEPLGRLVLDLVATRRGHATVGDLGTSRWLFPGGQPGDRSAPAASPSDSAPLASTPARLDHPPSSSSRPSFRPR